MNHSKTNSEQISLIIEDAKSIKQKKIKLPYKINYETSSSIYTRIKSASENQKNHIYIKSKKLSPSIFNKLISDGYYIKETNRKLMKYFKIYWYPQTVMKVEFNEVKKNLDMIVPILNRINRDISDMKNTINQIINIKK
jgi:hypothetical protein